MRSRKLTKRIEVWETGTTITDDGFGGNTVNDTLLGSSWAEVRTFNAQRKVDYGLLDSDEPVQFTVRKRNDITYSMKNTYIKYRNVKYMILAEPIEVDFTNKEIQFIGIREARKN